MAFQYRSLGATNIQKNQPVTSQKNKNIESISLLVGYVIKSNMNKKIKQSFSKIKTVITIKKKYSQLLAKKINFLFKYKQKQYNNVFFSCLIANKISFYNQKISSHNQLKNHSKTKAVGILFHALQKIFNRKYKSAFVDLKNKSLQYSKTRTFKVTHLFARISMAYRHKLQGAFNKLVRNKDSVNKKGKVFNRLQNFFSAKQKRNILAAFNRLKVNLYRSKVNQNEQKVSTKAQTSKTQIKTNQNNSKNNLSAGNKMQNERRQLQERSKQVQIQIQQLQQSGSKNLTSLKNQIARLEKQTQSLRFNNDLLDQNNSELQKQIQTKQLRSRRKLSKNQIWENVYNNLIYFLAVNRNKTITKQQLIECLQSPLVPCNTNLQELNEQNKILSQLLSQYKKSFPEPQVQDQNFNLLPYDLLKKKNRYYYMVLQVLSQWGISGSKELQQLNTDLDALQKKLVQ